MFLQPSERNDRARRDRYFECAGRVFENYVEALFRRVFPGAARRYVSEKELRQRIPSGMKACDGVVLYGDTVVVEPDFGLAARDLVVAMGDGVHERLLPRELRVLRHALEVEAVEPLGLAHLGTRQTPDFFQRHGQRRIGAPDLGHVSLPSVEPLPSCDPEHPHSRPRVPLERRTASEEQESDIGDLPIPEMPFDQTVVLQRLLDWPRAHRSPVQEPPHQPQVKVVESGLHPKPLLVSHDPQRLFPLVDQFLRLPQNLGTNPVGETIGLFQLSFLGGSEPRSQAVNTLSMSLSGVPTKTAWKQRSTPRKTPGSPNRAAKRSSLPTTLTEYGTRCGQTIEYVVEHPTWRYWNAVKARFDCTAATLRTLYGEAFAPYLKSPRSAFLVEGSPVIVRRPRAIRV